MEMILLRSAFFVAALTAFPVAFALLESGRPGGRLVSFVFGGIFALAVHPATDQIWHDLCQWLGAP